MGKDLELEALRKQLKEGKVKVKQAEAKAGIELEKVRIKRQLLFLKNPKKVALAKRLGRGLKITGRKVGKSLIKQGKLIAAQQERDRRIEVSREKMFSKKIKVRKSKKKNISNTKGFDPFTLDF